MKKKASGFANVMREALSSSRALQRDQDFNNDFFLGNQLGNQTILLDTDLTISAHLATANMHVYETLDLLALILTLVLFCSDCKKNPVGPQPPVGPDTTSHNFSWQSFTWGGGGASSINDVAILADTNIWAVGTITLNEQDSLGFNFPYGAAHWNGTEWQLKKLPTSIGLTYTEYLTFTGIIAFSSTDIWLACGGGVLKFDGNAITQAYWLAKFPGNTGILDDSQSVEKMWGTSSNNLYAVGRHGGIAHYDGSSWQKLASGTTLDLHTIYGATDSRTGEQQILAVGSSNIPFNRIILHIQGTSVTTISSTPIEYELFGLWFVPNQHYYVVGDGIYEKNLLGDSSWKNNPTDITTYGTSAATGNGLNDVFIVGAFGECLHWNGASWRSYQNQIGLGVASYGAAAVKGNLVVVAGEDDSQEAILQIGRHE